MNCQREVAPDGGKQAWTFLFKIIAIEERDYCRGERIELNSTEKKSQKNF